MTTRACPTCRAKVVRSDSTDKLFPFCSERCQLIDLGRWLGEDYRIPEEPDASGGGIEGLPQPNDR